MTSPHPAPDSAILFTEWPETDDAPLGQPNTLLPLAGRPMLQRVVEQLARLGCQRLYVMLGTRAADFRSYLGAGERWGVTVTYHHLSAAESLGLALRNLRLDPDQRYWLADAQQLPDATQAEPADAGPGRAVCWQADNGTRWTGWGRFRGDWLSGLEVVTRTDLEQAVLEALAVERDLLVPPLSVATPADYLAGCVHILEQQTAVAQGRGCEIHTSVQIHPPVIIGRHVKIAPRAVIGPRVILGDGAFIDEHALVRDAVVLPYTYVGESLELNRAVARGNRLANIVLDTVVEITDGHLMAPLPQPVEPAGVRVPRRERISAAALRWLLRPLWLLCRLRVGQLPRHVQAPRGCMVSLPRPGLGTPVELRLPLAPPRWAFNTQAPRPWARHFLHTFYPGLAEVGRSRLRLVGPTPRPLAEIGLLHEDWRALYQDHACGLLNEALLMDRLGQDPDLQFASDALACAGAPPGLLKRYLARVGKDLLGRVTHAAPDSADAPCAASSRNS